MTKPELGFGASVGGVTVLVGKTGEAAGAIGTLVGVGTIGVTGALVAVTGAVVEPTLGVAVAAGAGVVDDADDPFWSIKTMPPQQTKIKMNPPNSSIPTRGFQSTSRGDGAWLVVAGSVLNRIRAAGLAAGAG